MGSVKRVGLLDLLTQRFPEDGRKALHARVLCGEISVNGATERDPKRRVPRDADVEWKGSGYVGRGAHKLAAAIEAFEPQCAGAVVLDAGSSTGGFTETLLERGARLVYAVDVGTNQLAWKLRSDARVRAMEGTNVFDLSQDELDPVPDFAVCDLSFRSLSGIAFHIASLTRLGRVIALAKPQFERAGLAGMTSHVHAGERLPGTADGPIGADMDHEPAKEFSGVVADSEGKALVELLVAKLNDEALVCRGVCQSPVRGRRGNREYFLDLEADSPPAM